MSQSDTPRTEAEIANPCTGLHAHIRTSFARTLERALTAAQATIAERDREIAELKQENERIKEGVHIRISDADKLRGKIDELRSEWEFLSEIKRLRESKDSARSKMLRLMEFAAKIANACPCDNDGMGCPCQTEAVNLIAEISKEP